MTPGKKRRHSPNAAAHDTELVQFVAELLPHDSPEFIERQRKGRPVRSPSLPPDEPKPGDMPPPAV